MALIEKGRESGMGSPVKVGVSSCLLGEKVRYDGGHKLNRHITDTLGPLVELVPICPEVGCGLTVPREPMRLEGDPVAPRLVTINSRVDLTGKMAGFCRDRARELEREGLCGFIFKKNSPSCGLFDVRIHNQGRSPENGRGLFAEALTRCFPHLPVEEDERLASAEIREEFIRRVLAYQGRPD